jgi:hypothetical protein
MMVGQEHQSTTNHTDRAMIIHYNHQHSHHGAFHRTLGTTFHRRNAGRDRMVTKAIQVIHTTGTINHITFNRNPNRNRNRNRNRRSSNSRPIQLLLWISHSLAIGVQRIILVNTIIVGQWTTV